MSIAEEITYTKEEMALLAEFIDEDTGEILYPESDGKPMAENTMHFQWITTIQGGLDALFADKADVFVAGDLLWYPVQGRPFLSVAPDIMVAFGRSKGERGSYEQWKEENIAPQVVMEILSKGNTAGEMADKLIFYQTYGVQEYYLYDFRRNKMYVSLRSGDALITQQIESDFVSPILGVRFDMSGEELQLFNPNNTSFLTYVEQDQQRKLALEQKEEAIQEENKAIKEKEKALEEIERLKALLKEKGLE